MRVKRGVTARARHKKILKAAKGMQHNRTRSFRLAKQAVTRALEYSYRDRRNKKREFKSLWIQRINAAVRAEGLSYSVFMNAMKKANMNLDRKVLANIAFTDSAAFKAIVTQVKSAIK